MHNLLDLLRQDDATPKRLDDHLQPRRSAPDLLLDPELGVERRAQGRPGEWGDLEEEGEVGNWRGKAGAAGDVRAPPAGDEVEVAEGCPDV